MKRLTLLGWICLFLFGAALGLLYRVIPWYWIIPFGASIGFMAIDHHRSPPQ
jgi:hypothetical protein